MFSLVKSRNAGFRLIQPWTHRCFRTSLLLRISPEQTQDSPPPRPPPLPSINLKELNPYEILGITQKSTMEEAQKSYHKLAMKFHPDTTKEDLDHARIMFQRVGEAYRILSERPEFLSEGPDNSAKSQILSQRVDEVLIGERATLAARSFTERFGSFFGENHDSLINQHLKKRDLISAFEVFREMREQGIKPTHSTIEMLIRGCTMNMKKYENYDDADHFTKHLWKTSMELFHSLPKLKLKPDQWTYHEAIRASSKAGHIKKVMDLYEQMTKNAFTLPTKVVTNSVIEACVNTKNFEKALRITEDLDEIRTGMWFKGKFRADAITFSLALKAGIEGNLFERMPKILKIMGNDGLFMTPATGQLLLSKAVENNKLEAAKEILAIMDAQKVQVVTEVRALVQGDRGQKIADK